MKSQNRTPLFDALMQHKERRPLSLHVPGHKNGAWFPARGRGLFESVLPIDLTELAGLDDLHQPTETIDQAQRLLSSFYRSDDSWFLVGGSTVGNLAMIRAACGRGDMVLVQRNSHRSVMNGIRLAGARPVFLQPKVDKKAMLATVPSLETVKKALDRYPNAKAVVLTNPNYYGMAADLSPLIRQVHAYGIPVLVDEAHGAHFALGPPFPKSALSCGADAVVQSAHKTLPAMTMGAYLHVQGMRIQKGALKESLQVLQSSSPSYPIMGSLDLARHYMAQLTVQDVAGIQQGTERMREELSRFPQFTVIPGCSPAYEALDPLKITLQTRCSFSGFELARGLEKEGIYAELADPLHVLFVMPLTPFDNSQKLIVKMERLLSGVNPGGPRPPQPDLRFPELSMPAEFTGNEKREVLGLKEAIGCVVLQDIVPYPPGVPLVIRGERMTAAQVAAIQQWHESGGRFQAGGEAVSKGILVMRE
ncbi:MAG TPA: aminotransferase class I/II-fold pyridoxal phosphate-dependent enzyme [Bacillales bacterium]|nr:aminotransferase class I/II-fold pyridoxal phosphate-dependent enzyme [Bacillales bacterium]